MADVRHFKNRYIIPSRQPFDWFLLNLARWCACWSPELGVNFKFLIFDNLIRLPYIYLKLCYKEIRVHCVFSNKDRCTSVWWFVPNSSSLTVSPAQCESLLFVIPVNVRFWSSESKNCLNILCSYTMTHYTILTIKQQILMLKTAVYP